MTKSRTGSEKSMALRVAARFQNRFADVEGKQIVGSNVRITIGSGYQSQLTILIQELPSKPLKRKLDQVLYEGYRFSPDYWNVHFRHEEGGYLSSPAPDWLFGAEELAKRAGFSTGMDFKAAAQGLQKALDQSAKQLRKYYSDLERKGEAYTWDYRSKKNVPATKKDFQQVERLIAEGVKWSVSKSTVYYLEVEPADYEPLTIKGKDWHGTFLWGSFKFYADRDDDDVMYQSEGMAAFYEAKSSGGARKTYKHLKGDPQSFRSMGLDQFLSLLSKLKVAYNYVPTVWR